MQANKMFTVKELREALQNAPDDAPILIESEDGDVIGVICDTAAEHPCEDDNDPIYRDKGVMRLQLNSLDAIHAIKSMEGDLFGALQKFIV